jgi:hypothetical protein
LNDFFSRRSMRPGRPIMPEPPITKLPDDVFARLHPEMRDLDQQLMHGRINEPLRTDITSTDYEYIAQKFLGLNAEDLQVVSDMGMLNNLESLLLAAGDVNTAQGFRTKLGMLTYLGTQNIRPQIVKHAEEEIVQAIKYRIIDRGLPVPDDLLLVMRNFSGAEQLFSTRTPDFLVKVKKTESPISYAAHVMEASTEHSNLINKPIATIIEETTNVATASDKILANQVVKQFRKMDVAEIPPETMFYGRKGKGAKHVYLGPDPSAPQTRVMLQDINEDLVSVSTETFKRNYSPVALC